MLHKKLKLSCHLVTKQFYRRFLNYPSNKKTFIKDAQFGMLFGNVILYLLSDDGSLLLTIRDLLYVN